MNKKTVIIIGSLFFVIALAGLGTIAFQQMDKQSSLNSQLAASQAKLQGIHLETLASQPADLQKQLDDMTPKFEQAKANFARQLDSTTIAGALFEMANSNGLTVTEMTSTSPASEKLEGADFSTITMTATVQGNAAKLVNFIVALNNVLKTSTVRSVEITVVPQVDTGDNTTASLVTGDNTTGTLVTADNITPVHVVGDNATAKIEMAIYTYRGE